MRASQAASGARWTLFTLRAGQLANFGCFSAIAMAFRWGGGLLSGAQDDQ